MARNKFKTFHIRITPELLIEAFVESVYVNKSVQQIKITMSRYGYECPTHDVYITLSGRGKIKGKIEQGIFHGTVSGSEKQIKNWQTFFKAFIEVPEFSLKEYVEWLKTQNNS